MTELNDFYAKQTLQIPRLAAAVQNAQYDAVNLPAAPWGAIERDDRSETAPRSRGLVPERGTLQDLFIAELRRAHREGRT